MAETKKPITIAAIGDIHVGEANAGAHREMFREIADRADVLALCGDLTNLGRPREAEVLAEDLHGIGMPVLGVLGNHDHECGHVDEVKAILSHAGVRFIEGEHCVVKGVGFAGVKGFAGGFDSRMLDSFGEPAIKAFVQEAVNEALKLESALRLLETARTVVLLHYAPIAATIEGEPAEIHPFLGSSRLAETIDRYSVTAVFHGHAHHGTYAGRTPRGTPVYNVAAAIPKDTGRPYALLEV